ncbi:TRAP transporter small permease [Thermodesulfobacteriota bacterium]
MDYYHKLCDFLVAACKFMVMVMVPLMAIIVIAQVVMRYVFKSPFIWAEEAARYLLIWIACLGSAYAVREKFHISVLFFHEKLQGHAKDSATMIIHFLVIGFFVICVVSGFSLARSEWGQISPGLGMRMSWVLISVPVGFSIMTLFTLEELFADIGKIIKQEPLG